MIAVNVDRGMVGGVECEVVDGSELHAKLGSNAHFRDWIKDRIRQLKLVKNQDFENFAEVSAKPGRPPLGYTLTLKAAKKIAMAEHTDAGNAARAPGNRIDCRLAVQLRRHRDRHSGR